jgi:hypothetical protein
MPAPKRTQGGPIPFSIDPGQLPDDGSPVTFEQTFAKRLGPQNGTQNLLTDEDYEHVNWQLDYQLPHGKWTTVGVVKGRPYAHTLIDRDPGNYKATPIGRDGKPVESKAVNMAVGSPLSNQPQLSLVEPPRVEEKSNMDMPPWMQMIMQQQAEEKAEARRAAQEAKRERDAWERDQLLKDEARREREERAREVQAEREAQTRREAAERSNALIMAGLQIAQQMGGAVVSAIASKNAAPAPARDDRLQEVLLQHVLRDRAQPAAQSSGNGSLRESLDLLLALDQVAQSRADRLPAPAAEKDEDESVGSSMIKMLPMLVGGLGGGGQQAADPQAAPQFNVEAMLSRALQDPNVIAQIAARDPEAIARTFSKVVKSDKRLEAAVIKVMEEDAEGEDE